MHVRPVASDAGKSMFFWLSLPQTPPTPPDPVVSVLPEGHGAPVRWQRRRGSAAACAASGVQAWSMHAPLPRDPAHPTLCECLAGITVCPLLASSKNRRRQQGTTHRPQTCHAAVLRCPAAAAAASTVMSTEGASEMAASERDGPFASRGCSSSAAAADVCPDVLHLPRFFYSQHSAAERGAARCSAHLYLSVPSTGFPQPPAAEPHPFSTVQKLLHYTLRLTFPSFHSLRPGARALPRPSPLRFLFTLHACTTGSTNATWRHVRAEPAGRERRRTRAVPFIECGVGQRTDGGHAGMGQAFQKQSFLAEPGWGKPWAAYRTGQGRGRGRRDIQRGASIQARAWGALGLGLALPEDAGTAQGGGGGGGGGNSAGWGRLLGVGGCIMGGIEQSQGGLETAHRLSGRSGCGARAGRGLQGRTGGRPGTGGRRIRGGGGGDARQGSGGFVGAGWMSRGATGQAAARQGAPWAGKLRGKGTKLEPKKGGVARWTGRRSGLGRSESVFRRPSGGLAAGAPPPGGCRCCGWLACRGGVAAQVSGFSRPCGLHLQAATRAQQ